MTFPRLALAALTAAALAGCATKRPAPPPAPSPPVAVAPDAATSLAPRAYVTIASSIDRFMLDASAMAAARARHPAVRSAAAQIATDHHGISAQLSFAGRRLNLLPTGRMVAADAARLGELERSADFDAAYRRLVTSASVRAVKLHSDFADRGASPTLRQVARFAAPLVSRNLAALRDMPSR